MSWKTGAMLMDMMAVDMFMNVAQAINESADSGVAAAFMPVETAAAAQAEVNASSDTGSAFYWPRAFGGGGGSGDIYPI